MIAVLALQGDFEAHRRKLAEMGVGSMEVRRPGELEAAAGLILPGGESTTLWKFFEAEPWEEAIARFARSGRPILGTCAGAILLAKEVSNPVQKGLGLIDIGVERNAYGRQLDSFVGDVEAPGLGGPTAGRLHPGAPDPACRSGRRDPRDAARGARSRPAGQRRRRDVSSGADR